MTPIDQSKFSGAEGDCFAACVASILDLRLEQVPNFCAAPEWWPRFRAWAAERGFFARWALESGGRDKPPEDAHVVASGKSPRGDFLHAVVARGGEVIHDPHPSRAGIVGPVVDWIWLVPA